jgi:hypothetical protein
MTPRSKSAGITRELADRIWGALNGKARLTDSELRLMSVVYEEATGADSVSTIERGYERSPSGIYECCYPRCRFRRRDPVKLWLHVHGRAHRTERDSARLFAEIQGIP